MDIFSASIEELEQFFLSHDEKKFRAKQVYHFLYQKGKNSFDQMSNLSTHCKNILQNHSTLFSLQLINENRSKDEETTKYLWQLPCGSFFESVLIYSGERRTLCVSSQVGCPGRCAFCASGKMGLIKNLTTGQIVEQVVLIENLLKKKGERMSHIVFMGMGEPLANYGNVTKALKIITSDMGLHISQRKITLSTVGIPEKILALVNDGWKVNIAFSLHEVDQKAREKIIPFAKKYPLKEILEALFYYSSKTKRDITFEYILIKGVNDSPNKAKKLCSLLKNRQCTVNLIPLNPIEKSSLKRPSQEAIVAFEKILISHGISTTRRYTKGKDIAAACGQLAIKQEKT